MSGATALDLSQIRTDATSAAATFRTLIGVYSSAQVDALIPSLAGYATTSYVDSGLAGKANSSHTHTLSDISDAGTAAGSDTGDFATAAQGSLADSALQSSDVLGGGDVFIQVALSGNGQAISSGAKKGIAQIPFACTAVGFKIVCDPANEPSASSVEVDCNKLDLSTGAATSILSSVATIATGANAGTGTIDGTQSFSAGDLVSFDVDQGTDGKELIAILQLTPTS